MGKGFDRRRMRRRCGQSGRLLRMGTNETDRKKPELLDEEGLDGLRCIGKNLACSLKGTALAIPATKSDWRFRPAAEITHAKRLHHHRKRLAALGHFAHDADAGCWRSPAVNGQPARRG